MIRNALLALFLIGGLSCGDASGPEAGELKVMLSTPTPGQDGAIMFRVNGPAPLTSLTPEPGLRLFTSGTGGVETGVILTTTTGMLGNDVILRIGVEDVRQVAQYSVTWLGTSSHTYEWRCCDYTLTVVK